MDGLDLLHITNVAHNKRDVAANIIVVICMHKTPSNPFVPLVFN